MRKENLDRALTGTKSMDEKGWRSEESFLVVQSEQLAVSCEEENTMVQRWMLSDA